MIARICFHLMTVIYKMEELGLKHIVKQLPFILVS